MNKLQNIVIGGFIVVLIAIGAGFYFSGSTPVADQNIGYANQNGDIVVTKKVTYSDLTTTGTDITNTVSGGSLALKNLYVSAGNTALASGTLFQIYTSGGLYGTTTKIMSVPVGDLTAGATLDLSTTSTAVVMQRTVLEDGAKLKALCTGATCKSSTAAGTAAEGYLNITMIFQKTSSQANLYE
jgi:preprotein translocase subunit YajC